MARTTHHQDSDAEREEPRPAPARLRDGHAPTGAASKPEVADERPVHPFEETGWQEGFFLRRRLEKARIPKRFANKTLESFNVKGIGGIQRKMLVNTAKAYISKFTFKAEYPQGLLMRGQVGCGKSHLAVAILREVILKGHTGLYYNSPDLLRDIRATFDERSEVTEDDLIEEVTTTDLLVFDDVGAEKLSDFVLDRFYLIINERYEGCKPVIITTNLELDPLENRLGKRIVSRIFEMCNPFGPFPEEDWRRREMR